MKNITLILFLIFSFLLKGQQELVLHTDKAIPQVNLVNPSKWNEDNKFFVALPSISFNFSHSGFTYNDLIQQPESGNQLTLTMEEAIDNLNEKNYLFSNININYLMAGVNYKSHFFGFYMSERLSGSFMYRKNLVELLWRGNEPFLGEEINIAPELNVNKYREWGFTYGKKFEKWDVGVRLKYLQGLANISTSKSDLSLYTDSEDYSIRIRSNFEINTSRVSGFEEVISPFFTVNNPGAGIDLGLSYQPNEKWSFSTSFLDLGFINWQTDAITYSANGVFDFDGIDIFDFATNDSVSFEQFTDSIQNLVDVEQSDQKYRNFLQPAFFVSANYSLNERHQFTGQVYGEYFNNEIVPSFTLGYMTKFKKLLGLSIENNIGAFWSYRNGSPYNLGLNYSIRYKNLQFFVAGDNLLSFLFPRYEIPLNQLTPVFKDDSERKFTIPGSLRNYNIRLGVNLMF